MKHEKEWKALMDSCWRTIDEVHYNCKCKAVSTIVKFWQVNEENYQQIQEQIIAEHFGLTG